MATGITFNEDETERIAELLLREDEVKTIAERVDLHGETLKILADILKNTFDKNKNYKPKNART